MPKFIKEIFKDKFYLIITFAGFCFLIISIFFWFALKRKSEGLLEVTFMNVGQGDSIYIKTPGSHNILIDTGPKEKTLEALGRNLTWSNKYIDMLIITHPDNDHDGGLNKIIDTHKVGYLVEGICTDRKNFLSKVTNHLCLRYGTRIILDDYLYLDILFPDRKLNDLDNNHKSLIVNLVYHRSNFLITGDAPKMMERYIGRIASSTHYSIRTDILKVGHHGSKTSTDSKFIANILPRYSIISAEKNSRYGHPHKDTISMLLKFNSDILETSKLGDIKFVTDGSSILLK